MLSELNFFLIQICLVFHFVFSSLLIIQLAENSCCSMIVSLFSSSLLISLMISIYLICVSFNLINHNCKYPICTLIITPIYFLLYGQRLYSSVSKDERCRSNCQRAFYCDFYFSIAFTITSLIVFFLQYLQRRREALYVPISN
jgi:hypothetical protein